MKKLFILLSLLLCNALYSAQGTLITTGFHSALVPDSPVRVCSGPPRTVEPDGRRLFTVYLPPDYDPNDSQKRYPSVYWLVGFGGYNEPPANELKPIFDFFINNGQMVPMIVIFPDPSLDLTFRTECPSSPPPPGPTCKLLEFPPNYASYGNSWYVNSDLNNVFYEDYIFQELIPYIDANYNTIPDRNFRALAGHSMGGFGAFNLGMRHPEAFTAWAAESGTPPWMFTNPTNTIAAWANPPSYQAFTLNSILIGGILQNGGVLSPCNQGLQGPAGFTDFIFSLTAALSPNTTGGTPFLDLYQVDPPIIVDANGVALLEDGMFEVVDFASDPNNVFTTVVDKSVVLDPNVIATWNAKDPFFQIENNLATLAKQAIYVDGGDDEPLNNYGSRQVSDLLMSNMIDNEYILYFGNHTDFLFDPCCSRNTTVFKMFSAQFAAAATCATQISSKLMGNLTIELNDEAEIDIFEGSILSVQTSKDIPGVVFTDVQFRLHDEASILVGTASTQGGALQIGDPFTKAQLQEFNTGPATPLAAHEVRGTIYLDGNDTLFEIGREGFFGVGIGITGKSNNNLPLAPKVANFWGMTSLANLKNINIIINKGTISHQVIESGDGRPASLWAMDVSDNYLFDIVVPCARILGGGNMICTKPDPRADPANVNRQVRLLHPTVFNLGNELPNPDIFFDPAAGIINVTNFQPGLNDPYIENPISTSTAYTNYIQRGILQSTPLFSRGDVANPYALTTQSPDEICDFLLTKKYEDQPIKLANLSRTPQDPKIAYLQNARLTETIFDSIEIDIDVPLIERVTKNEFPPIEPNINFNAAQAVGALGVQLARTGTSADIPEEGISNVKELVRIYNSHAQV